MIKQIETPLGEESKIPLRGKLRTPRGVKARARSLTLILTKGSEARGRTDSPPSLGILFEPLYVESYLERAERSCDEQGIHEGLVESRGRDERAFIEK